MDLLKREKFWVILLLVLVTLSSFSIISLASADTTVRYWAVLVDGYTTAEVNFSGDVAYMRHVLYSHYDFAGIYVISSNPKLSFRDNSSKKDSMRWTIREWLFQRSDYNDVIFIFFSNHGGGYNTKTNTLCGGRYDASGDEVTFSSEHFINGQWRNVDECIQFLTDTPEKNKYYWDDELKADLNYLATNNKYGMLIIMIFACFSGGLIDDLSGSNRIIMTSTNETYTSKKWFNDGSRFLDEWPARFIDALHGQEANFDPYTGEIVHYSPPKLVNADTDGDGKISIWEAWKYAWDTDGWRVQGYETPWLDDDEDRYPTYVNGQDYYTPYDDGNFAKTVYFPTQPPSGCPTLFVWNGTSYVEEGKLDIHAYSDIILQHKIRQALIVDKGKYRVQLRELDNATSHIDHVRLYAVDESGKWHMCPLIHAYHSQLGQTTLTVMFNDDRRVDLNPMEILDLHFLQSTGEPAYFIFELSGYNKFIIKE